MAGTLNLKQPQEIQMLLYMAVLSVSKVLRLTLLNPIIKRKVRLVRKFRIRN